MIFAPSKRLLGASEMVPTIIHADEASFHNLRASPAPEDNNDAAYIQADSGMEGMLPIENLPHNLRDGSVSIDTIRINAKLEDCDSHAGVARALHTKTNLSPEMSSNSYQLEATSSIKVDKNVEVERVSGCTLEIQEIFSGATCISQSVSVPVEPFDPIRLYVSDKEPAANNVVAELTVDSFGVAGRYDTVSLEASLKSLQSDLKEGGSVPPSPIRGLIQELPSPNLPMKQHNRLDSHNEECANFSFELENKFGNVSSGNTFKKTSTLGTEDESESVKSTIDDKSKHSDQEEKLLASSSESHIMSSDMTKDQVVSSNFVLPCTEKKLRFSRKTLIVLDLNGLLADINRGYCNAHTAHKRVGGKSVFKRPFCDDFLKFCFERFSVGVWSSRRRYNMDPVVDYLMGDLKHKLLFCWKSKSRRRRQPSSSAAADQGKATEEEEKEHEEGEQGARPGLTDKMAEEPATPLVGSAPPSAPSPPMDQSEVELEVKFLQALEFYHPAQLLGVHRHFVLYGMIEYLQRSSDKKFKAEDVLQLLDRFYNLEAMKPDDEDVEALEEEDEFSLPESFFSYRVRNRKHKRK
ncbi:uncharacterized protein LOC141839135 isoform X2 [Curcuma longa]|uniref:uncharacterized protein LOC141839135 isoform X2 n=1 Tax=Curcuma longa TaxID=136217 RepID=UPI003D9F9F51